MKVRLYISRIDPLAQQAADVFSQYRLAKLLRTTNPKHRAEGICSERLMIHALRDTDSEIHLPPEIRTNEYGKPELENSLLHFSLSHSGSYCACAVGSTVIGADIQKRAMFDRRIAERNFSAAELEFVLNAEDMDAAFTKIWAMKESYVKALGKGLAMPLSSFCTLTCGTAFFTGEHDGHFYAVCSPTDSLEMLETVIVQTL